MYTAGVEGRTVHGRWVGSYVDFCEEPSGRTRTGSTAATTSSPWREFIRRCDGRLPSFPVDLGVEPGGTLPEQKLMREPLVDAADAAAVRGVLPSLRGAVWSVVLAATALVVHEIGGEPVYRTVVPFHTRSRSRWSESVGWVRGRRADRVPASRAQDFPSALRTVRAELQANRRLSRMPIDRVLRLLGTDFHPTSPDLYSIVSYVDARDVPGAGRWPDLSAYALLRVSYGDQVCAWITRLPEGLWFAARYPDIDVAHKNLSLYVERLRDVVRTVARGGVHQP